jgi:hypothetical protein
VQKGSKTSTSGPLSLDDPDTHVAKKVVVEDLALVQEYAKEARELIALQHKHIVSYIDDFVRGS